MVLAFPVVLFPALAADVFDHPAAARPPLLRRDRRAPCWPPCSRGWTARVHHHGRAIVVAAAAYGLFIGLVGLAPTIGVALGLLVLAGAADMISGVFRGTVWNQTIPEQMRGGWRASRCCRTPSGRSAARCAPGWWPTAWSVRGAIASGGFACVAGVGITAVALRDFWRTTPHRRARDRRARAPGGPRGDRRLTSRGRWG
jgi:hypothetical protein